MTLWTVAHQDPLSTESSRQEYWSGLPFPSPGDLPDPVIEPGNRLPLWLSWYKNPPTMQETWVRPLGCEDPLEKGKATHSSILEWRIPWTVQSMGSQRVGHD